jgi:hypothetical protein
MGNLSLRSFTMFLFYVTYFAVGNDPGGLSSAHTYSRFSRLFIGLIKLFTT